MNRVMNISESKTENRTTEDKIIWFLTTVLFSSFIILDTNEYISYILLGVTGLIFLIIAFGRQFKFPLVIDRFQIAILAFAIYCALSSIWARNSSAAIEKAVTIFEIMVCMTVLYCHYSRKDSVYELLECVRWAGYIVTIYALYSYGIDTIRSTLASEGRVGNSFANINSIAIITAISLILSFFKLFYYKFSWSMIFAIPEIIMIAASGSRKSLMIAGIGIVLVLLFRYTNRNIIKTLVRYIFIAVILILVLRFFLSLDMFAGINERMEGLIAMFTGTGDVDHSALLRQQYVLAGLAQFKETPILGIGISNSGYILMAAFGRDTYLHNNFIELLACGGIIGFGIYYSMILWPLYKIWKYRTWGDSCTVAVIILIIILLVMDYGMVSYYSKSTYFYLMIYYLQAKILIHLNNKNKKMCYGAKNER